MSSDRISNVRTFRMKSGMSLVAAMIAVVVLGFVMVGLMKFMKQTNQNKLAAEQSFEVDNLRTLAKQITRTQEDCGLPSSGTGAIINGSPTVSFDADGDATSDPIPVLSLGDDQITMSTNFRSFRLTSMELVDMKREPNRSEGTANLRLSGVELIKTGASDEIVQDIPVQLSYSSATGTVSITECFGDDGNVTAATQTYLDTSLPAQVETAMEQKFPELLRDNISTVLINHPDVFKEVVEHIEVRKTICGDIKGTNWDEETEECSVAGPAPASASQQRVCGFIHRTAITGYGGKCSKLNAQEFEAGCNANCAAAGYTAGGGYIGNCADTPNSNGVSVSCNCCTYQ